MPNAYHHRTNGRRPRIRVACIHVALEGADVHELTTDSAMSARWEALCVTCADDSATIIELHAISAAPPPSVAEAYELAMSGDGTTQ